MAVGLTPYTDIKDSGVGWLGHVPAHWKVLPNRAIFSEINDRGHAQEQMLAVTISKGVIPQKELLEDSSKKDSSRLDRSGYKLVQPGDIAYNKMRAWQGALGVSDYRGIISPAYIVQRPRTSALARYLHYLFRTPAFAKEAERWSYGITSDMWSLRPEHFKMIYSCVPPVPEQSAIARFLDHSTARIDRCISAKEKLIALLEEQKQIIIHEAVTGQIDVRTGEPYPEYKKSGVEHFGKVPKCWRIVPLKRILAKLVDCVHKTAPKLDASDFFVIRTTAVREGKLIWDGTYCTDKDSFDEWTRRCVPRGGDVIFTREAPAGEACLVPTGRRVCLGQRTVLLRPDHERCDPSFLVHMIYAGPPKFHIELASQGSTVGHFNVDDIGSMPILLPTMDEQKQIVDMLALKSGKIEEAGKRINRELSLLRKFRTRLVADVVTGKLDIREAAIELPDTNVTCWEDGVDTIQTQSKPIRIHTEPNTALQRRRMRDGLDELPSGGTQPPQDQPCVGLRQNEDSAVCAARKPRRRRHDH